MSVTFTEQQQAAIDHRGSPLRIIAGAGTGKTATLTARFVSIVERGEAEIGAVLALTFTRKAAIEMRERIIDGLDRSYTEFWVETFHAFCQKVLRIERASRGLPPLSVIDGHARYLLLQQAVKGHEFPSYGNRREDLLRQALVFIDRAKDELLSPEGAFNLARSRNSAQLHDLATAYDLYQRRLTFGDREVDWGELQTRLIHLFESNDTVLKRWQSKFRYILVDEYQDINHAQCKLIELLAGDGTNLTVVGDVDQSIYAFRGASHRLLAEMEERFPDTRTIHLSSNFRSHQPILDVGNALIRANPDRHGRQSLEAHEGRRGAIPTVFEACDEQDEAEAIARQIARLYWLDNVPLERIAVLLRSVQVAAGPIEQALASYGLRSTYRENVADSDAAVADVLAVLRLIDGTRGADIIRILTCQDVDEMEILSAQLEARASGTDPVEALLEMNPVTAPVARRALLRVQELQDRELPEQVYEAARICGRLPLSTTISRDDHRYVQSLGRMIERAMQIAESGGTRRDFIPELEGVIQPSHESDNPDASAVQIMTVHAAKGLEFDHVFVASLAHGRFPLNRRLDRGLDLQQPESLHPDAVIDELGDADRRRNFMEEERRLGYVALTRACQHLYLSHAQSYARISGASPVFVNEIRAAGDHLVAVQPTSGLDEHTWNATELARLQRASIERALDVPDLSAGALADIMLAQWTLNELPGASIWREPSAPTPYTGGEQLRLSFSALNTYATCARKYYYSSVLGLPEERSSAYMLRGHAIHSSIQWLNERRRDGSFPSEDEMIDRFRETWNADEFETAAQERQIREQSERLLRRFHHYEREQERDILGVEQYFTAPLGNHFVSGRIDCIARRPDGTIEIIDYKNGKTQPTAAERDLQLGIYQIAYNHLEPGSNAEAVLFTLGHKGDKDGNFFPEFEEKSQRRVLVHGPEKIDAISGSILDTAAGILRNEFPTAASAYTCRSCAYRQVCEGVSDDG